MLVVSRASRSCLAAICAIALYQPGAQLAPLHVSQKAGTSGATNPVKMVIRTDRAKYSPRDTLKLNAALENTGDKTVYVDRRMFWTGYTGGLKLVITDEQGKSLPARLLGDALMPPPKDGDTSILVRLEPGFFYGTSMGLIVKALFTKPGRYQLRVIYKSWLSKELVLPQFRELPALWADKPEIVSKPLWIEVTK